MAEKAGVMERTQTFGLRSYARRAHVFKSGHAKEVEKCDAGEIRFRQQGFPSSSD